MDVAADLPKLDLKILIVEDDETSNQLLSIIMDKYGLIDKKEAKKFYIPCIY
jgi:hypothetical protein